MDRLSEGDSLQGGYKRKAPKEEGMTKKKPQRKPWGTNGPPPREWIEVFIS